MQPNRVVKRTNIYEYMNKNCLIIKQCLMSFVCTYRYVRAIKKVTFGVSQQVRKRWYSGVFDYE